MACKGVQRAAWYVGCTACALASPDALSPVLTSWHLLIIYLPPLHVQLPKTNEFYYDNVYMFHMYGKEKDAVEKFLPVMNALATLRVRAGRSCPYPIRELDIGADGEPVVGAAAAAAALELSLQGVMDELKKNMGGFDMLVCSCGQ